jgi:hypothetical protein
VLASDCVAPALAANAQLDVYLIDPDVDALTNERLNDASARLHRSQQDA